MSPALLALALLLAPAAEPERPAQPTPPTPGARPARSAAEPGPAEPLSARPAPPKPGRLTIELRDAETRQPAAGRARVSAGEKELLPPGAIPAGGGFFLVDGSVRLEVPAGGCRLQVDGGPLRLPYDRIFEVAPGGAEERTIFFIRPPQLAFERAGWYPTDPLYSAGTRPPAEALLAARARGLAALGLDGPQLPGGKAARGTREVVRFGWQVEADPRFGSRGAFTAAGGSFGCYLDCGRPRRINPWKTAVPWRPELRDFYDPLVEATAGLAPRMYFECVAGQAVGGFELDGSAVAERLWFALLNEGFRVPALAGSRASLSAGGVPEPRMLLRAEGAPSPAALLAAAAAGHSTLSFGPVCFLAIDKKVPGDSLELRDGDRHVVVRALASTERRAEIARLELWRNGQVLQAWRADPGQTLVEVELVAPLEEPGWMLAKCYQRVRTTDEARPGPAAGPETVALTNPIWIVPKTYRASLGPVRTALQCQVLDEQTGKTVAAQVTVAGGAETELFGLVGELVIDDLLGAARVPPASYRCPNGAFSMKLSPAAELTVSSAGYGPRRLVLFDELGLWTFAKRLAAMPPEKAAAELSSPATFNLLRAALGRLDLTIELRRAAKE